MSLVRKLTATILLLTASSLPAQKKVQNILAFYDATGEPDHVDFARQAIEHFSTLATRRSLQFRATTDWTELNTAALARVDLVVWLNGEPHTPAERNAFEQYMEHGGGWLGCHVSAFNEPGGAWKWFPRFLGGAVFDANEWPPLPADLVIDISDHPVTRGLPHILHAPANEWYSWNPNPRSTPAVKVLLSLSSASLPIGLKDRLLSGDIPVVWTNTRYRMLYVNMGHGAHIFDSPFQNRLWDNAVLWLTHVPAVR